MPIVPNDMIDSDDVATRTHCSRSTLGDLKIKNSHPCVWYHVSEFISIFNQLEQDLSSSLSRRLLHASYAYPFSGFFEAPIQIQKPFFKSKMAHISRILDEWARLRMMAGRGMVSVIEWPVRFHVDQPVHPGIEVGEVIRMVERITGLSWKATWKDDGGRNLLIQLESIEIPFQNEEINQSQTGIVEEVGVDWIRGSPQVNGSPIIFMTTASICEFVRLLNEVPTPNKPEKDRFPDSANSLEKMLINIIGESMKAQLPLILDWNLDHSAIMDHLICRGIIRNYESLNGEIRYESTMPRSFSCAPIVSAWEASTGEMAIVKVSSNHQNQHTISFLN